MGRASRHRPRKLPEKLRKIREQANLSMNELVDRLGSDEIPLYKADVSKYEAGTREPPLVILLRYARLANVFLEVLVDDSLDLPLELPSKEKSTGIVDERDKVFK